MEIDRPNQAWSTDITYVRLARGFVYWVAVIDWYSRKVLAWRVSNTLDKRVLRRLPAAGIAGLWQPCNLQQRPG